jgi:coenzyme F420-reducing hydrogenase beta subunit
MIPIISVSPEDIKLLEKNGIKYHLSGNIRSIETALKKYQKKNKGQ